MYRGRFIPAETATARAFPAWQNVQVKLEAQKEPQAALPPAARSRRIACLLVPDFAIAAIIRVNPALRDQPLALTRMPAPRQSDRRAGRGVEYQPHSELSAVSALAKAAGIRAGMTVAQARALIPDLVVMHPSAAAEQAALDALADAAESIAPVIEPGVPGCIWVDLTGGARLYRHTLGSHNPDLDLEQAIADEIARRIRQIGLEAAIGIAANKEIAHLAARCGGLRIVPLGREREFIDWMPLELAELDGGRGREELELRLKRLGIRRLGDLARLDLRAIGSRLGEAAVALARIAQGAGSSSLIAQPRRELFAEAVDLEYGIENLEALSFVLNAILQRLGSRLELRGLVAGDLSLSLGLADRRRDERRVIVAAATGEIHALLMLLRLSLEKTPPAAAIETIRLMVEPRHPRPSQHDLFVPPAPAPDRLEAALARIAALCGPDRVGTLLPADSYRPEAVRVASFAPPPPPSASRNRPANVDGIGPAPASPHSNHPHSNHNVVRMALRTLRPAAEIEMMLSRETPEFVRGANICARVVAAAGPWRRQGEWWAMEKTSARNNQTRPAPSPIHEIGGGTPDAAPQPNPHAAAWQASAPAVHARDYYEIALEDGGVYRMYRDLYSGKWFVDGVYD